MAIVPVRISLRPTFSRIIENEKCQGTFYKGQQKILTSIVQGI